MSSPVDLELMTLALREAARGTRAVRPNPLVGCALRGADGRVITGFHARAGGPHAEIEALRAAEHQKISVAGSTVAVTLEPCSHHGKTPPCVDALIAARPSRVLVGGEDPNPQVRGQGIARLRAAGIEVVEGVLQDDCEALNREWLAAHRLGRAFVTLKLAMSLDGLWTAEDGSARWITADDARAFAHNLRTRVDLVVTGRGTVERDDPTFTARDSLGTLLPEQPRVCVLARSEFSLEGRRLAAHPAGAWVEKAEDLEAFLRRVHAQGSHDVMVEAGPTLSRTFLEVGLVDELWIFYGARLLGGEGRRLAALGGGTLPGWELVTLGVEAFASGDFLLRARPKK